jgi:hypothetical protein
MAAVGILMIGIGGWLMYEAYKGSTIADLKSKLSSTANLASSSTVPTTDTNMLDSAAAAGAEAALA